MCFYFKIFSKFKVEELILDLKDIKTTHMPSSSSSCPIDDNILLNKRNNNNNDHHHNHHHGLNTNISNCSSSNSSPNDMLMMNNTNTNNHNHNNNNNNNDTHQMHQNQGRISLNSSMDTIDLDSTRQHNSFIDSNVRIFKKILQFSLLNNFFCCLIIKE